MEKLSLNQKRDSGKESIVKSPPNAGKLYESLRSTGYNTASAVCDIVDNSLDAQASFINIDIVNDKAGFRMLILDDGIGMNAPTLKEALKLGSITEKNPDRDLGKFGMGLVTAGLSMCRRITVFTKTEKTELLKMTLDLDAIIENNSFILLSSSPTRKEAKYFKDNNIEHGTLVVLDKFDNISDRNISGKNGFEFDLNKRIGQVFRKFIDQGKKISLNGISVESVDPLMMNSENTFVSINETKKIRVTKDGKIHAGTVDIKLVLLEDFGLATEAVHKYIRINPLNQGFYILRNDRELVSGSTLSMFTRHPSLNRIRCELNFSGNLDEILGTTIKKEGVSNISKELKNKIKSLVWMKIVALKQKAKQQTAVNSVMFSHDKEIAHINSRKKHLQLPKFESDVKIEREQQQKIVVAPEAKQDESSKSENKRDAAKKTKKESSNKKSPKSIASIVDFKEVQLGPEGNIYEPSLENNKVTISWNIDHPYYEIFTKSKDTRQAVNFLIFSMSTGELSEVNDENVMMFENMRSLVSENLRQLLN